MARNQAGEKSKRQLLRSKDTRWSLTELMRAPSVFTALQSDFFIFIPPEFSLHLQPCCADWSVLMDNQSLKHTLVKSARAVLSLPR